MTTNCNTFVPKEPSFPHQQKAFELSAEEQSFALFMEQGTGKTKVVIDTASYLYQINRIDAVLVLAPNGIQENWHFREIPKFCGVPCRSYFRAAYKEVYDKYEEVIEPKNDLVFLEANIEWVLTKRGFWFMQSFINKYRTLLVIDESTLIKNPSATRTKKVMMLGKKAHYRRIMTGTPTPQGAVDLYSQMRFLDERILPYPSYLAYKCEFCVMIQKPLGGRSFLLHVGDKNLDKLGKLTDPFCFRVLKKDCLQLPEKIYKTFYTVFHKEQEILYNDVKHRLIAELSAEKTVTITNVTAAMIKLQQLLSGFIVDELGNAIRTPTNRYSDVIRFFFANKNEEDTDHNRDVDGNPKKAIIFFRFKKEIEIFKAALQSLFKGAQQFEFVEYTGDIGAKERNEAVDRFQKDPKIRIMLATSAAARGLTLTEAKTVIYFSQDYNLETRLQSEDRAHRIGQTDDVTYWNVCLPNTVDEKIQKALLKKQNVSEEIASNWRSFFE